MRRKVSQTQAQQFQFQKDSMPPMTMRIPAKRRPRTLKLFVASTLAVLISCLPQASAAPWFSLTQATAKCFAVYTPAHHTLLLEYQAPDLTEEGTQATGDDDDPQKPPEMSIHMFQRPDEGPRKTANTAGSKNIRLSVRRKLGKLEFKAGQVHGDVQVCVQAARATLRLPQRVSLKMTYSKTNERPKIPMDTVILQNIDNHMNAISSDLYHHLDSAKIVLNNLETSKDAEVKFYEKSVHLRKAIKTWPMFRMFVICMAGFLQVSHVVRYMKARRIY